MPIQDAPEMQELIIQRMDTSENSTADIPSSVIMVRPTPGDAGNDLLFLDQVPIPKEAWSYDTHDKILRWRGAYGGGNLHFSHDHRGAMGVIGGDALQFVSVQAKTTVTFLCDVALDCGVAYLTDKNGNVIGFHWDADSAEWKNAQWIKNRLLLHYSSDKSNPLAPPDFTFLFEDLETKKFPWDPQPGEFAASLGISEYKDRVVWDLSFTSSEPPPKDGIDAGPAPDTVFPYWLAAREDFGVTEINGALQIDDYAPGGNLAGFRGVRVMPMVAGYYQTDAAHPVFGLFGGHICLDGKPVHRCLVTADALSWTGLPAQLQQPLGLPASGEFAFDKTGETGKATNGALTIRRLDASEALENIATHKDLYPNLHAVIQMYHQRIDAGHPDMIGLLLMTPFKKNEDGAWGDDVQKQVMDSMSNIMNSFVPKEMWRRLFPNQSQPVLSGELAKIAHSPVPGVNNPTDWYKNLSTAVLTQGLAGGVNPNCQNMNGPRAEAWLRDEVADSKVYEAHSQLLFQYEWNKLNKNTQDYLEDQYNNSAAYSIVINEEVVKALLEIDTTVTVDIATPPDLIGKLKAQVQEAGVYANTNKLYWAFAYYTYNTRPAILGHIAQAIGAGSGSMDGTVLTRTIQQHIAVLTALDPSGFYARQYSTTINTFLATNILPSMFGFTGEADDFSLIRQYLKKFVEQNINNPDRKMAEAAGELQKIIEAENFEQLLAESIAALRSFSGFSRVALALPQIASQWVEWFKRQHPRFSGAAQTFGSLLIGGMSIMSMVNLIKAYERWDKLSDSKRAQLVLDTIQMSLQVVSAVVKRGIRVSAIFNVAGMSSFQRSMGVMSILATGNAKQLNTGLLRISNTTAQWLGDTAGAASLRQDIAMIMNVGSRDAAAVSWTAKVFGRNLNEFIACRLGPLMIIGSLYLSVQFIREGASGVGLGAEIVNIASGALTLFAMAGGWLIQRVPLAIVARMVTLSGPLAMLAAIVGVALMFYQMFQKPPDPVEQFVKDYVKPAGLYVVSKCSSIDYVIPYELDSQNELLLLGFSLLLDKRVLTCRPDGSIALTAGSFLPECVWKAGTNGMGLSQIATLTQPKADENPMGLALSLMSDHTISFKPRMTAAEESDKADDKPAVLTQTWLTHTIGKAATANENTALASLQLTIQPVFPDAKGQYRPNQAMGWIVNQADRFVYSASGEGTLFTLKMEGIAPNYVKMSDLTFLLDSIPSLGQTFGPGYGLTPSSPVTFTEPANLPNFLRFDKNTGTISPNGGKAKDKLSTPCVLEMQNALGKGKAIFSITVEPAPVKPSTV
jgi:hypothetical protein